MECWLQLKWHVKMDLVRSIERQNWELRKRRKRRKKRCTKKVETRAQGSNQTKGNKQILEVKAEVHSRFLHESVAHLFVKNGKDREWSYYFC